MTHDTISTCISYFLRWNMTSDSLGTCNSPSRFRFRQNHSLILLLNRRPQRIRACITRSSLGGPCPPNPDSSTCDWYAYVPSTTRPWYSYSQYQLQYSEYHVCNITCACLCMPSFVLSREVNVESCNKGTKTKAILEYLVSYIAYAVVVEGL